MSAFDKLVDSLDTSSGATWLDSLVGQELISNASRECKLVPTSASAGKFIGLYFSAKWCGPCKVFTPVLRKSYEQWKESKKIQFEVIFMSLDSTQEQFRAYFESMPWLAPKQLALCQEIAQKVSVMSIPTLLIISPEGKLMTSNGVGCVRNDPEGKNFPWEGQTGSQAAFGTWVPLLALLIVYFMFRWYFDDSE